MIWTWLIRFLKALFGSKQPLPAPLPPQPAPEPVDDPEPAKPPPTDTLLPWDSPQHNWHNVRVLCDRAGLTLPQKNLICACIYQESRFLTNPTPNQNRDAKTGKVWSTDFGIIQINDHFHIGAGKDFPSVEFVLSRPEIAVAWMIQMYRAGQLSMWSSFSTGAYKRWLSTSSEMWRLAKG